MYQCRTAECVDRMHKMRRMRGQNVLKYIVSKHILTKGLVGYQFTQGVTVKDSHVT